MRSATLSAVGAALLLSACGDAGDKQAPANQQSIVVRGDEQKQLHKFSDLDRAIALKRAIYDSGYVCKRVASSGFVGTYKNLEMWTARCDDGRNWAIFAGPDGSAQVRDCVDVASYGLPECVIKPGAAADKKPAG